MHRNPALTVDAVLIENRRVLLIRRKNPPFQGKYALPGGFVEYGESTESAVLRELKEETGIDAKIIKLIGVYSDPERDPRGHTVSVAYLVKRISGDIRAGDDAEQAKFFLLNNLPDLAFDHKKIIMDAVKEIS